MDDSSRLSLLEVSPTGACDLDLAETADVVGLHLDGVRPPLVLIRTWCDEIPNHRALARELGPDQPIYSVRPPRGDRIEDYPADVDEWSDFCLKLIAPLPIQCPWLVGGWSFGGVVGLESARKLDVSGDEVRLVMMLDTRIPKRHARSYTDERKAKRTRREEDERLLSASTRLESARVNRVYVAARLRRQWRTLSGRWKRLRGRKPRHRHLEKSGRHGARGRELQTPLQRTIAVTYLKYRPRETRLSLVQLWTQESLLASSGDATLGWANWHRGPFASIGVKGTHHSLFESPNIEPLARGLRDAIRRACE